MLDSSNLIPSSKRLSDSLPKINFGSL